MTLSGRTAKALLAESDAARAALAEAQALDRAMAELPDKYREVLALQVIGGYSGLEMSEMLGLPRATVNTRLFRARQHLRRVLEGDDADENGVVEL